MNTCRVEHCDRPIHLKRDSLCNAHYLQMRKGKPFTKTRRTTPVGLEPCSFDGCTKMQNAKGFCVGHYWMSRKGREMKPLYSTMRPRGSAMVRDDRGNKECTWCKEWRPESDYGPHSKNADGLRAECSSCRRNHYWDNRDELHARRIETFFNITLEDRDDILASQGGMCACCGRDEPGAKGWCIDHDHACCPQAGRSCGSCIRGILCSRCNLVLGSVDDRPETLKAMIGYLGSVHYR